jgi:hypothetical protein
MTLPQPESLLGYVSSENTRVTTVACLLPISVYWIGKTEVHFNTTNIVGGLRKKSEDLRSEQPLRSRGARSGVWMSIECYSLNEPSLETVAKGMADILPP